MLQCSDHLSAHLFSHGTISLETLPTHSNTHQILRQSTVQRQLPLVHVLVKDLPYDLLLERLMLTLLSLLFGKSGSVVHLSNQHDSQRLKHKKIWSL